MVLEPLGSTLASCIESQQLRHHDDRQTQPLRALSRRILSAMQFVHSKGIVHRDIQASNVMFPLKATLSELVAGAPNGLAIADSEAVVYDLREDGKRPKSHAPPYVVEPKPLCGGEFGSPDALFNRVVFCDFGSASTFKNANDGYHTYPTALRPPEILLGLPLSVKSDIWALGCLMFRIVTLSDPIFADHWAKGKQLDNEQLCSMIEALGPMPEHLVLQWQDRDSFLSLEGKTLGELENDPFSDPLGVQISQRKPKAMSAEEATLFGTFVRAMLRFEPDTRPSAEELLKHPWLAQ